MLSCPPCPHDSQPTGLLLLNLSGHQEVVRDLSFTPSGSLILVSASRDKTLRIWDLNKHDEQIQVLSGHLRWVYCCSISPTAVGCALSRAAILVPSAVVAWFDVPSCCAQSCFDVGKYVPQLPLTSGTGHAAFGVWCSPVTGGSEPVLLTDNRHYYWLFFLFFF
uniref:Uncharacterized protein n=1 Tax=Sciurus vulgaris TaxID=55149 RepID=A0A8D2AMP2_SCIVU